MLFSSWKLKYHDNPFEKLLNSIEAFQWESIIFPRVVTGIPWLSRDYINCRLVKCLHDLGQGVNNQGKSLILLR